MKEAVRKVDQLGVGTGMRPIQEQNSSSSSYSANSTDTSEHAHSMNGAAPSSVGVASSSDTVDGVTDFGVGVAKSGGGNGSISPSLSEEKSQLGYLHLPDDEIIERQQHAERVGYRVSQV